MSEELFLPEEHLEYVNSLDAKERSVYAMAKMASYNLLARDSAELARDLAEYQATHDELTGLLNKIGLESAIQNRIQSGKSFGAAYLDMDDLKKTNDKEGHDAGDKKIRKTADILANSTRHGSDDSALISGRLHGDEFVIIYDLTPRNSDQLTTPRERLKSAMANLEKSFNEKGIPVSMGGAVFTEGMDHAELLRLADQEMYKNKQKKKLPVDIAD